MKLFCQIIIIFFLLIPTILIGQFEYNFIRYTLKDGLPSNKIYDIVQDKEGFIWFGTDKGIAKFDGYEFKLFTTRNGLPNNDIWSLYVDNRGRVWAKSYYEGLVFIDNDKVKSIPFPEHQLWTNIASYIEINNKLWVKGGHIVYSYDDTLKKELVIESESEKYFYNQYYKDEEGKDYSLAYFYGDPINAQPYIQVLRNSELIDAIHITDSEENIVSNVKSPDVFRNEKLYYWNEEALFQYDFKKHQYEKRAFKDLIYHEEVKKIKHLGFRIWQINDTIYHFDETFNLHEKLPLNNMELGGKILVDTEGNWWMNTGDEGVICLTHQGKKNLQIRPISPDVTSVQVDKEGQILYTNTIQINPTKRHKILVHNGEKNFPVDFGGYSSISIIKPVFIKDDRLLILNYSNSGFNFTILNKKDLFSQKEISLKETSDKFKTNEAYIFSLPQSNFSFNLRKFDLSFKDAFFNPKTGNIWTASHTGIELFEYDNASKKYTFYFHVRVGRVYTLAIQDNILWFGGFDGLYHASIDDIAAQHYKLKETKKEGFDYAISDLQVDKNDRVWIATDGFGLFSCTDCVHNQPEFVKGTEGAIIQEIFIDEERNIWLATSNGVKKIQVLDHQNLKTSIITYSTAHGLPTPIINSVFVKDDIVYVATSEGITLLYPPKDHLIVKPKLLFPSIKINNEEQEFAETYHLTYRQNNLEVKYLCLSFKSQRQITYRYKMEGISDEWRDTKTLEREYLQLRPGTYVFQVQAFDINGVASEMKKITFIIVKPWWQTNLFWFSLITLIGLGVYSVFRWQIRRLAKHQQSELAINKKFAELELQALQSQMNPHFIFNSLSAIQNFILNSDIRSANKYLVKFSKLMRAFLDASKEKYITLQDELSLLKLYVELEQLRFKGHFDVDWEVNDDVDVFTEIPSMLFQPFVENAINHGLSYRETKGLLKVHLTQNEHQLHCVIEDNGVGREQTKIIQEQSLKTHKSRGMSIIEERLKTLELIEGLAVEIDIVDLYDDEGQACGTQVNILFKTGD